MIRLSRILPLLGRWQGAALTEGARRGDLSCVGQAPSTTLRAVPLPQRGRILAVLLALLFPVLACAHETRPAYLELVEQRPSEWRVVWKQPVMGDRAVRLEPALSNGWLARQPADEVLTPSHFLRRWHVRAPAADLAGARLTIGGLEHSITDVLVHVRTAGGKGGDTILRPGSPSMTIGFGGRRGWRFGPTSVWAWSISSKG